MGSDKHEKHSYVKWDEKYLEREGVDAHEVKTDYRAVPNSRYNIHYDKDSKSVVILDTKGNLFCDLEMNKDQFFDVYGGRGKE